MPLVLDLLVAVVEAASVEEGDPRQHPRREWTGAAVASDVPDPSRSAHRGQPVQDGVQVLPDALQCRPFPVERRLQDERAGVATDGDSPEQCRPRKVAISRQQMARDGIALPPVAEVNVDDAIPHRGKDHEGVDRGFDCLEGVEGETHPCRRVERRQAGGEGRDIPNRTQGAAADVL